MSNYFNVEKFRTHIGKYGDLAHPSKFVVRFLTPPLLTPAMERAPTDLTNTTAIPEVEVVATRLTSWEDLSLQCEAAELPGYTVNTLQSRVYGPAWHVATTPTFNEIQLTFLCTSDMWEKELFDQWMSLAVPLAPTYFEGSTSEVSPHASYPEEYYASMLITQMPNSGTSYMYGTARMRAKSYSIILENAFPISMQPLPLNWGDTEGIHRLQVAFRYTRWRKYKSVEPGEFNGKDAVVEVPPIEVKDGEIKIEPNPLQIDFPKFQE